MKLLFDQNLSYKLVDMFPDSKHIRMMGFEEADDRVIWDFAKENNYIIVSKDSDFHQFSFLYGPPPKVVWISKGNCTTSEIAEILREQAGAIKSFEKDSEASFLEIS